MKIGILGNGSIGSATALYLADAGHKVLLFGNKKRQGSASKAAGAMLNVFGELENNHFENVALKKKFDLAKSSLDTEWPIVLKKLFGSKSKTILNNRKTVIFKNKFSSPYEIKHFDYLKKQGKFYKKEINSFNPIEDGVPYELNSANEFIGLDEGFINTTEYFTKLDSYLDKKNVKKIDDFDSYKVLKKKDKIFLKSTAEKKKSDIQLDYLVVALGSYSQKLFLENKSIFKKVQKIFFGTGFAFSLFPRGYTEKINNDNKVYRTMNRGNACGFHIVPSPKEGFYFGASSTITDIEEFYPRLSSIKVLSNELERQFDHRFSGYQSYFNLGHRPVTADTYPLFGALNKNSRIIIATGNKRDGLTASPKIASLIQDYIGGNNDSFEEYKIFNPERNLLSYFDKEIAIKSAAEAKISGEMMHYKNPDFSNWNKIVKERVYEYEKIYKKINLNKKFGIHPELLSLYLHKKVDF
jgi:glycine/D-amino acid oxidase-like deaminating enzyme